MKIFEVSSKTSKNGKRKFKAVLHEIYPDSCVNEADGTADLYNLNGITWLETYCQEALPTLIGQSIRAEFLDEERTELCGHGMTGVEDNNAIFEDAVMIGCFTNGYIDTIDIDGEMKKVCIGEGELDAACYNNFIKKLDKDLADGKTLHGSVEISRLDENDSIIYKYGYKDEGRIPEKFRYSGYCLLGIKEADYTARLIELNQKEEIQKMNEAEMKALIAQVVSEMNAQAEEKKKLSEECAAQVADANARVEAVVAEKNALMASSEAIQKALDEAKEELQKKYDELDALYEEMKELREELGKAKARERVGEMNAAIANFSDAEKEYAKAEIDAFNENPCECEIYSVVSKIYEGIGMAAKKAEHVVTEINEVVDIEDIFGEVGGSAVAAEDTNIF